MLLCVVALPEAGRYVARAIIRRICAFDVKKVIDSRFPMLVSRYEKRIKNFFDSAGFGEQVGALLVEVIAAKDTKSGSPVPNQEASLGDLRFAPR